MKHNLKNFLHGKPLNAIYDGYSFQPLYLGHTYATSFQHYHDFEPHWKNHVIPHYGIFSRFYFGRILKSQVAQDEKYSSFKKSYGPPFYSFNPRVVPVEHDSFLARRGIPATSTKLHEPRTVIEDHHHDHHTETKAAH